MKPKYMVLSAVAVFAGLCLAAEVKPKNHQVVVLESQYNWASYDTNGGHVWGYNGFIVKNANVSQGAPDIRPLQWYYDTTNGYSQLTPTLNYAQTVADLLDQGFEIKVIGQVGDQYGINGQIVTLVK